LGWYVDDVFVKRGNIAIAGISDKTVNEVNTRGLPSTLTFQAQVLGASAEACLGFSLPWAPPGASIDPETGVFTWTPSECQGPGVYRIPIYVVDYCNDEANDMTVVTVAVNEVNERPILRPADLSLRIGQTLQEKLCYLDVDCPANPLQFTILSGAPSGLTVNANSGVLNWTPTLAQVGSYTNIVVQLCDNGSPNYCTNVTISVTAATNAALYLQARDLSFGFIECTIVNGRTNCDYVLQEAEVPCQCPDVTAWRSILTNSPTEMPFVFIHQRTDLAEKPAMFYRLKEKVR
jgi:hypothetical protein